MEDQADEFSASLPESKRQRGRELYINLLFLERKLDEARRQALTTPAVVEYDNGGGQTGERVSPWVQAYGALLKSYGQALKQLEDMVAAGEADSKKAGPAKPTLADMRANFRANVQVVKSKTA
jgi:hypothetical protein